MTADKKEKSLTQRQQKRIEWWKKINETDDSSKTDAPQASEKTEKRKLKSTHSDGDVSSPAPKKSKIESLKEESGLTDAALGSLRTAKGKKKKIRKAKAEKLDEQGDGQETPSASKKSKLAKNLKAYVLFVGNIPYEVTKEDIEKHFLRTGGVKEVRLLTDKDTGKSKGCAYIDFVDSKSHKFGLRLHESMLGGRMINVEFTSRGRKTPKRTERLKEKNRRMARMKRVFDYASKKD